MANCCQQKKCTIKILIYTFSTGLLLANGYGSLKMMIKAHYRAINAMLADCFFSHVFKSKGIWPRSIMTNYQIYPSNKPLTFFTVTAQKWPKTNTSNHSLLRSFLLTGLGHTWSAKGHLLWNININSSLLLFWIINYKIYFRPTCVLIYMQ